MRLIKIAFFTKGKIQFSKWEYFKPLPICIFLFLIQSICPIWFIVYVNTNTKPFSADIYDQFILMKYSGVLCGFAIN
eukprot:Pgem_evm1s13238